MKSDEGILRMLSKSSIIRNQYENVIPYSQTKIPKGQFLLPFFLFINNFNQSWIYCFGNNFITFRRCMHSIVKTIEF